MSRPCANARPGHSSGCCPRPFGKGDFLAGYALAFGALAIVQALVATAFAVWVCGLDVVGPVWLLVLVAVVDALLGAAIGLFVSAFARTEFQAVQFMPAFVIPQFLLCGLLVARSDLPAVLRGVSDVLPLSYAVDAMVHVSSSTTATGAALGDLGIVAGLVVVGIALGALTLRRRTP